MHGPDLLSLVIAACELTDEEEATKEAAMKTRFEEWMNKLVRPHVQGRGEGAAALRDIQSQRQGLEERGAPLLN